MIVFPFVHGRDARAAAYRLIALVLVVLSAPGYSQETCSIIVDSDPEGADVLLDSVRSGTQTPARLDNITPGYHVIRLEKGELEGEKTVTLQPNVVSRIMVTLTVRKTLLMITSEPAGAEVLIDGQPRGRTPYQFDAEGMRTYKIGIRSIGYLPEDREVELSKSGTTTLDVALHRYGELSVESNPSEAEIYVDGEFQGRTPQDLRLSEGVHTLRLHRAGSRDYTRQVQIEAGKPADLVAELVQDQGELTVLGLPNGALVTLDGNPLGTAPIERVTAPVGPHWLHYSAEGMEPLRKPIWISIQGQQETIVTIAVQEKTRWNAIWRSMLFPGIGQMYSEQSLKAILFLSAGAICAGTTTILHLQVNDAQDAYQVAHDRYAKEISPFGISAARENMVAKHNLLRQKVERRNSLMISTATVWALNCLDQVLFSSTPWRGGIRATTRLSLHTVIDQESIGCQLALEW